VDSAPASGVMNENPRRKARHGTLPYP